MSTQHTVAVTRRLDCGCYYTADKRRHWCPACSDALGGHPEVKYHAETPLCTAAPALLEALKVIQREVDINNPTYMRAWRIADEAIAAAEKKTAA